MKASQLTADKYFRAVKLPSDIEISGICPDSERVRAGELFVAVEGLRRDGHEFAERATARGAVAILVTEDSLRDGRVDADKLPAAIFACEDTREGCARLFSAFYGHPSRKMKMVGVTGTNGKTSVSSLIYEILTRAGMRCGLIGTTGAYSRNGSIDIRSSDPEANMTTPDPEELYAILAKMAEDGTEAVVMEVTSHALALRKVVPIDFEIGVFTNLTRDHLDFHGDMEGYFAEKSRLFDSCRTAVINYDDRYGRMLADNIKKRDQGEKLPESLLLCSSEGRECNILAEDVRLCGSLGIEYKLISRDMRLRVRSPLSGEFNVMNTLQAAAVCARLGVSAGCVKDALAHFTGSPGRLERVRLGGGADISVYIDYAHTPDALENVIRCVRGFASADQRVTVLFGCGGDRDREKRPIMGNIASTMADRVIITSDNSRSERAEDIIGEIISGIDPHFTAGCVVIPDRREAIRSAVRTALPREIILLCGKGHEKYEIDREGKRPFSEKDIVKEAYLKYRGE